MRVLCGMCLHLLCAVALAAQGGMPAVDRHLQAAQSAKARGDCHAASVEYGAAARMVPRSGELRSNEGVALYCEGDWSKAAATFQTALRLNRDLAAPHLFLGLIAYRLADSSTAIAEVQRFLQVQPSDTTAHLWLGYAYVAKHQYQNAVLHFERVLEQDSANLDAHYALGQCYLEIGRGKARQLEALDPDGAPILHLAGEQYRMMGNEERAATAFAAAAKRTAETASATQAKREEESMVYQEAHDAEANAQRELQAVITAAPGSYRAHQIQGDSFMLMQQEDAALREYRVVAQLNPDLPGIHQAMSTCLMKQGHFADALAELQIEKRLQPESARVRLELGRTELAVGNDTAARTALQEALERKEVAPPETYLLLARAELRAHQPKQAISHLQQYITAEPTSSPAFYLLARAYRTTGDHDESAKALATAQQLAQSSRARELTASLTRDPSDTAASLSMPDLSETGASALPQP